MDVEACNDDSGDITVDRILEEFRREVIDSEEVLGGLLQLGLKYKLSGSDLYNKFEAYVIRRGSRSRNATQREIHITLDLVKELDKEIAVDRAASLSVQRDRSVWALSGIAGAGAGGASKSGRVALPQYIKKMQWGRLGDGSPGRDNYQDQDSRNILLSFNGDLPIVYSSSSGPGLLLLNKRYFEDFRNLRYMDIDMEKVSEYICSRIEYINSLFSRNRPLVSSDTDEVSAVGRLNCETLERDFVLNNHSFFLETFDRITGPHIINLDLSPLSQSGQQHSFFPGQIIALTGKPFGGNEVKVAQVFYPPVIPPSRTGHSDPDTQGSDTTVVIASGPFTASSDLNYTALERLTEKIEAAPPSLVILLGPFVDERHPILMSHCATDDPNTLFSQLISPRLERICRAGSKLILIPATYDMISEWVTVPQPPIGTCSSPSASKQMRDALSIPVSALLYPNPSTLYLNDALFSIISTDTIGHICRAELTPALSDGRLPPSPAHGPLPGSKYGKYFFHLLSQQTTYPLYPHPNLESHVNLQELSYLELPATPDVLITPSSAIPAIAEDVGSCLCVNPGIACGCDIQPSGSFAVLSFGSRAHHDTRSKFHSRTRVDIMTV